MTSKRAQRVYGSQAAALIPARKARRSQSFGGNESNILNSSRLSITQNLSLFGKMTKNELQLKLHETLCDKDKLTEQASQAIRQKLAQDHVMIQLVHENVILKEENTELKEFSRGMQEPLLAATR